MLICDTGPLLAAIDRDDPDHGRCAQLFRANREDLLVPVLVLSELDYWCHKLNLSRAWLTFLDDLIAGAWQLETVLQSDLIRMRELQEAYASLSIGAVDASIVALTERLDEKKLATLDVRHFSTVKPRHISALELLPH